MEIIPILSTIILVATIATFILAIAAYVLYKVRERRARSNRVDVVTDAPYVATQPALAGQPYTPNALPPMQAVGQPLALPAAQPLYGADAYGQGYGADTHEQQGYGAPVYGQPSYDPALYGQPSFDPALYGQPSFDPALYGQPSYGQPGPIAVDTNADGRYDTVYEARPTYQNPLTGAPAAYQPAPDVQQPRAMLSAPGAVPGMAGPIPGVPGVQSLPGMSAAPMPVPMPVAAPVVPLGAPVPNRGSMFFEVTNQGLVPTPGSLSAAEEHERAHLGAIRRGQEWLDVAEDASKDRIDTLRREQDAPVWL